jgi:hypothetical protein
MLNPRHTPQHDEREQRCPADSEAADTSKNWRDLAEQASHEPDPHKLMELVSELCEAIDRKPKPVARVVNPRDSAHNNSTEDDVPEGKNGTDSK